MRIATRRLFIRLLLALTGVWGSVGGVVKGQTSIQNFGTGTGSHTSQTGSTTFIPNPTPSSSGTTYARAGNTAANATINRVTTSNPLGTTGAFVRAVASTSTSCSKMSPIVGYANGTSFYTKMTVLFGDAAGTGAAATGTWQFVQGAGTNFSDNQLIQTSQAFVGLQFTYGASSALTLNYLSNTSWIVGSLTSSALAQTTVYTIEIVGNNTSSGTINYTYNGVAKSVAFGTFDLYINGTQYGSNLAKGAITAGNNINAMQYIGISSTSNAANLFVDDVVVYNTVPAVIGSLNQLDWVNLQWPSTGTIALGGDYSVYAQVYESGVTNAVGQGAGISCWIGYSASNSDPSGAGWTWIPANYNLDVGNNDEYGVNIGPSIPASGTYYLASRFQQATAPFIYGGCNVGGGGFWDGTNNVSGNLIVNPPPQIDWANLQFPSSGTISLGGNFNVYAQVFKSGITEPAGQGANISAWIGYSSINSNPSGSGWTWIPASFNVQVVNNDEYFADLGIAIPAVGTYYYASRFKYGLADYVYGGYNITGGGFWDGAANLSGILTINPAITQVVISQVYGGGGNSVATYKNDFIELFNRGTTCISLTGWSVQYASASGNAWAATNLTNVTLAPGQYYLIQEAAGGGGTTNLPTPDATGSIAMSNSDGKVALVNNTTALTGSCPKGSYIVDFVGYGSANCSEGVSPTGVLSNATAAIRKSNGCIDTDQNSSDFSIAAPTPRNSASPFNICSVIVTITAGGPTTFCQGGSVLLTSSVGSSYLWSTGATTQSITVSTSGFYTVTVTDGHGCSAVSAATVVTVNALPTIALGSDPAVCAGTTAANLPYSATTASPDKYSIVWSAPAITTGFLNSTDVTLPSTPIVLAVPAAAAAATYTGTLTVKNSTTGCSSTGYAISVTINAKPTTSAIYHQ